MSVFSVTNQNFDDKVLRAGRPVLLDFWAPWCGPCKLLSPVVEEIARRHPEIGVGKINVDEERELTVRFGVSGIPALFYMKDGRVAASAVGVRPRESVEAMLK